MNQHPSRQDLPRAQRIAERILSSVSRFFHIEAVSGVVLLIAAAIALVWANSPAADTYHAVWHTPLTIGFGSFVLSQSLHFWINDALMTVFFLVVGMEIRREIHDGALASLSLAALPLAAAIGGVVVPALIYLGFNSSAISSQGWAVPTATDIAFAVGVLALLGRSIPGNVRVLLLALAIIDDIVAVLIIAVFYSGGLDYSGLLVAAIGIAMVLGLQKIGVGAAYAYIVPGGVLWGGLLMTGAHPTLAGVVLGLMTPVFARKAAEPPLDVARRALQSLSPSAEDGHHIAATLRTLDLARRELLAPVVRIPMVLHGWVAYGVMPLFALANAGVTLQGIDMEMSASHTVMFGVMCALVLGKPLGIIAASALVVRLGWCRLPQNVTWGGVCLIGLLAGIGFTMSIFIATLAFADANLLGAAKLGVLLGSLVSGVAGLAWGAVYVRRRKQQGNNVIAAS